MVLEVDRAGTVFKLWVRCFLYNSNIRNTVPIKNKRKKAESFTIVEVWRFWLEKGSIGVRGRFWMRSIESVVTIFGIIERSSIEVLSSIELLNHISRHTGKDFQKC